MLAVELGQTEGHIRHQGPVLGIALVAVVAQDEAFEGGDGLLAALGFFLFDGVVAFLEAVVDAVDPVLDLGGHEIGHIFHVAPPFGGVDLGHLLHDQGGLCLGGDGSGGLRGCHGGGLGGCHGGGLRGGHGGSHGGGLLGPGLASGKNGEDGSQRQAE